MAGLQRVLKLYGSMICEGKNGSKVVWLWDYVNDKARKKKEMTKEEIEASEKTKWLAVKSQLDVGR